MTTAVFLATALVLATSMFHYSVLRWLSHWIFRATLTPYLRILIVVLVAFVAHIGEVGLYAIAYMVAAEILAIGGFGGLMVDDAMDYLYFSIVSYTSLGLGDIVPNGHLRFLGGVEALNGLLLIAWSGSFIYIAMGRLWPWEGGMNLANTTAPNKEERET